MRNILPSYLDFKFLMLQVRMQFCISRQILNKILCLNWTAEINFVISYGSQATKINVLSLGSYTPASVINRKITSLLTAHASTTINVTPHFIYFKNCRFIFSLSTFLFSLLLLGFRIFSNCKLDSFRLTQIDSGSFSSYPWFNPFPDQSFKP